MQTVNQERRGEDNMTIEVIYNTPKKESFISLSILASKHSYIGFIPEDCISRYMLIIFGSAAGYAVNPSGTWTDKENQKISKGTYVIFEKEEELIEWLKG